MPYLDFWEYVLSIKFLVGFALTAGAFLPLLWSVWVTWRDNDYKQENLMRETREQKRQQSRRRRAMIVARRKLAERQSQSSS